MSNISENNNIIDNIFEKQNKNDKKETWARLDRCSKMNKLNQYIEIYTEENNLSMKEKKELQKYIMQCLDRKRLQNTKEVKYNKETGKIEQLPYLLFNTTTRKFTLKRNESRVSTLNSLGHGKTRKNIKKDDKNNTDNL